jgi:hypothetical protein
MNIKRSLIAGALALSAAVGIAGAASAEGHWDSRHPRQEQVLSRAEHQRHLIRRDERRGEIGRYESRRLLHRVNHVAREDHRLARANGGYITRSEKHDLNRQETRLRHQIPG